MMRISRKKAYALLTLIGICLINLFLTLHYVDGTRVYTADDLRVISIVAVLELGAASYAWFKMSKEICSPFFIMFIAASLFCVGQTIGWALGLNMGDLDLLIYIPYIDKHYLGDSLLYSLNAMILFLFGGVCAFGTSKRFVRTMPTAQNSLDFSSVKVLSTFILIVSIPCVIINLWNILPAVFRGGYWEFYSEIDSYSKTGQFIPLLAGWFPIALLMKYAIHIDRNPVISRLSLVFLFAYIAVNLYIGGRSGAVMMLLAFIITKQYLGKPIKKKMILPAAAGGYLFVGILNTIADIRLSSNRSMADIFSSLTMSISSTLGDFIGELGWSMSSLAWTMELTGTSFRWGTSYWYAFTAIIPNLGFWTVHPATLYSNLGEWMQETLGRSSGLGYTFVAETYANFSWFGLALMFLFGFIISRLLTPINRQNARYNFKYTIVIIMIFTAVLKPFIRSSFSAIMRPTVFTVLLLGAAITIVGQVLGKKRG